MLFYVDRKVVISGERDLGKAPLEYNLEFPGAGFYWAEFRVNDDQTAYEVVRVEKPEKPRLVIDYLE